MNGSSASTGMASGRRGRGTLWPGLACLGIAVVAVNWVLLRHESAEPAASVPPLVAPTEPLTAAEQQRRFRVPPGFVVELVAAEPDVVKPINMGFDDRGRLWVTESVEYPLPAPPDRRPRDRVRVLEDCDGDGAADRVTTFADGLNIPIGVLPVTGGCLVYSIPSIQRLTDTDGDGRADRREVLYDGFGFRDTHGMASSFTWGFDGWVYGCHGFANNSAVQGADGTILPMHSGNTYRLRPDGSRIEPVTHGQANPFGLCFDPRGDLYAADSSTRPVTLLLRGGYYPCFGKAHDGLGFAPEMCRHDHGSTGIAGVVYYAAEHFPPPYRDRVYLGNVVTHRIHCDSLAWHGSTPVAVAEPDFLTCDDPWFRPVDLKLGPDGALYVADFYNRIIGHYEVPLTHPDRDHERGRIWRIVYRGRDGRPLARPGARAAAPVAELLADLADPNLVVRLQSANQLVERGGPDVRAGAQAVVRAGSPRQRLHALWVLERLEAPGDAVLQAAADPDPGVRVHALRVLAERRDMTPALRRCAARALEDPDACVRRAAAAALGAHPRAETFAPLLALYHAVPPADTHLLHVVRMALRDHLRDPAVWAALPIASWSAADRQVVAEVALGIPTREAASFLADHSAELPEVRLANLRAYVRHAARHGTPAALELLLAFGRGQRPGDPRFHADLLRAALQGAQERGEPVAATARCWAAAVVARLLASPTAEEFQDGAELGVAYDLVEARQQLVAVCRDQRQPPWLRRAALQALATSAEPALVTLFAGLLHDRSEDAALRDRAARALAGFHRPAARAALAAALAEAPRPLQATLALELAATAQGAEQLVQAVAAGQAPGHLLRDAGVRARLGQHASLRDRLAALAEGPASPDPQVQEVLRTRHDGFRSAPRDPAAGAAVFQARCAGCHQLAGRGGRVGPPLDGVGTRGLERLLEDMLDPDRNVDPAFAVTTLVLRNGRVVTGLIVRQEGEVLILADADGRETRVPRDAVEERLGARVSLMPSNLANVLPEGEFYDLLAYLLAQAPSARPGP